MDIGSSFTYMFEDESWIKKLLLGGVITLVPIVNFAALGYVIQIVRNVRDGQAKPLPEWDKFGEYFMSGLYLFVIGLVYSIPIILLACIQGVGSAALGGATGMALDASGGEAAGAAMSSGFVILQACTGCLMLVWAVIMAVLMPAIMVRFAETGEIGSGFRFSELTSLIKADVGSYLIVAILMIVASSIIAPLGIILCVIGVIFTQFWAYMVWGHLLGQLSLKNQVVPVA